MSPEAARAASGDDSLPHIQNGATPSHKGVAPVLPAQQLVNEGIDNMPMLEAVPPSKPGERDGDPARPLKTTRPGPDPTRVTIIFTDDVPAFCRQLPIVAPPGPRRARGAHRRPVPSVIELIGDIVDSSARTLRALLLASVLLTLLLAGAVLSARSVLAGIGAVPTAIVSVLLAVALGRRRDGRTPETDQKR